MPLDKGHLYHAEKKKNIYIHWQLFEKHENKAKERKKKKKVNNRNINI
jgi:hypothetical protein